MIEISNLRKHELDGAFRLEADIKFVDMNETYPADKIYFLQTLTTSLF